MSIVFNSRDLYGFFFEAIKCKTKLSEFQPITSEEFLVLHSDAVEKELPF